MPYEKDYPSVPRFLSYVPVVFLGGPNSGSPDWFPEATSYVYDMRWQYPNIVVANPNLRALKGPDLATEHAYNRTCLWRAARNGAVLIWLNNQSNPAIDTTSLQFGLVAGRRYRQPEINLVLGIDPAYEQAHPEIAKEYRAEAAMQEIEVFDTLQATCRAVFKRDFRQIAV